MSRDIFYFIHFFFFRPFPHFRHAVPSGDPLKSNRKLTLVQAKCIARYGELNLEIPAPAEGKVIFGSRTGETFSEVSEVWERNWVTKPAPFFFAVVVLELFDDITRFTFRNVLVKKYFHTSFRAASGGSSLPRRGVIGTRITEVSEVSSEVQETASAAPAPSLSVP